MFIKNQNNRRTAGMTLVEMLIGMAMASILMVALANLSVYTARSFAALGNYVDLDRYSRKTLDILTREIRNVDKVVSYSSNQLIVTNYGSGVVLSYTYDPINKTFTRTNGTTVQTLLSGCDAFSFSYFQDVTMTNSFQQYPATGTNDLKVVQLSWICSRQVINRQNTESMQSAKIVMRKI